MPRSQSIPAHDYIPGSYSFEIDTPNRADRAVLTLTREAPGWPDGDLFDLRILERDRGDVEPHLLYSQRVTGGVITHPNTGQVNPVMEISLQWAADRDKDLIRFEADVLQTFRTAITLEFI